MDELTFHKGLVEQWEHAEADLKAIEDFASAGGEQRIRISCAGAPEVEELLNQIMRDSQGMNKLLGHARYWSKNLRDSARSAAIGKVGAA